MKIDENMRSFSRLNCLQLFVGQKSLHCNNHSF